MKISRFSEEQIIGILKEHQAGLGAKELCRTAWDQRCDLLQVAFEIQRNGSVRHPPTEGAGGRECEAEGISRKPGTIRLSSSTHLASA